MKNILSNLLCESVSCVIDSEILALFASNKFMTSALIVVVGVSLTGQTISHKLVQPFKIT